MRVTTLAVLSLVAVSIAVVTGYQMVRTDRMNRAIINASAVRGEIQQVFVLVQGAEAAQRGFLLTGQEKYLAPYNAAVVKLPETLHHLANEAYGLNSGDLAVLSRAVRDKMNELGQTIVLKRAGHGDEAVAIVSSGTGYSLMAKIRGRDNRLQQAQGERISALRDARDGGLQRAFIVIALLLITLIIFLALSVIATLNSLRERNTSLRQLSQAKFEADDANRAKSEFLASMSHELRTPLNAILGFSEIIKTELFGPIGKPDYLEYAEHIHNSGTHLLDLINDVLDLSKISAGKMELREQEVSIASLVYDSLALVRGRAQHVDLIEEASDHLPHIWADNRLLKQILVNLLTNAIKFTSANGTVTIAASQVPEGIRIAVTDTGIGMSPNEIAKAMSEYGQVDSKVARDHQGTGLGLPICKSLAELHGGTLDITSHPGHGTTVALTLPASRIMREDARAAS